MKKAFVCLLAVFCFHFLTGLSVQAQTIQPATVPKDQVYQAVLKAILNMDVEVDLSRYLKGKDFNFDILEAIHSNEPYVFYVDFDKTLFYDDGTLELGYLYSKTQVVQMRSQLNAAADALVKKTVPPNATQFQKVLYIHDALANTTKYDKKAYTDKSMKGTEPPFTAYGALVNKLAVCNGYALAANLLLQKVGIESIKVDGNAGGDEHAWNLVKVDGAYYYMDVTWDDSDRTDVGEQAIYQYFLVPSSSLATDHSWNTNGLPKATSTRFSYLQSAYQLIKAPDGMYMIEWQENRGKDNGKLFRVKWDGTGKTLLIRDSAFYPVIAGDWIYFSNYSDGGYLYKLKKDGTSLTLVKEISGHPVKIDKGSLLFLENDTNKLFHLKL